MVLDLDMIPVFEAEVLFATTAGVLASGGAPVLTDDQGMAGDTLRVFEDDPDEIEVTATSADMSGRAGRLKAHTTYQMGGKTRSMAWSKMLPNGL